MTDQDRSSRPGIALPVFALILAAATVAGVYAAPAVPDPADEMVRPDGIHVLDGSYVLNVGQLHVNITNHGLIGSHYTQTFPYSHAPSAQWPGGSGHEYLYGAGLWVGGKVGGQTVVTTGQPERELRPQSDVLSTIFSSVDHKIERPWPGAVRTGRRLPDPNADDDHDGQYDEDMMNGLDDDGDGLIDEDYGQIGDQMFTCAMYDGTGLVRELYPEHEPLNIEVIQRAAAWYQADYQDMAILDFEIINRGLREMHDIYLGFYMDGDIQRRGDLTSQHDDLAGLWSGAIRGQFGEFHRIEVAWMRDADPVDPLPGYIGTVLLDHNVDFSQYRAPRRVTLRSFQIFATNAAVNQNGEPRSDSDRYALMSTTQRDRDRRIDQPGDLKTLISSGPFNYVKPGATLNYRVALVVGDGLQGMLQSALRASELQRGHWFDMDDDWSTGIGGMETKVCTGDLPPYSDGSDPIFDYRFFIGDNYCVGTHPRFGFDLVYKGAMTLEEDGRLCTYINADNCEEMFRATGEEYPYDEWTDSYFETPWRSSFPWDKFPGARVFTGSGGRETRVPWVEYQEYPPRPPNVRLSPRDGRVEVYWDDISEHDPDYLRGVVDFESYRVWRVAEWTRPPGTSPGHPPLADQWQMIGEYDLANFVPAEASYSGERYPLGRNTGLEPALYDPVCLTDPLFEGLAEVMFRFVQADSAGRYYSMPPVRDSDGDIIPGAEGLVPWETYPTVLDTFFAVTARPGNPSAGIRPKRAFRFYMHVDSDARNGFENYYAVVARDHQLKWLESERTWVPKGFGIQSEPGNNYQLAMAGPDPQTAEHLETYGRNIYVYPNPATREALAEYQQQPPSGNDPTGVRVTFNNLPAAHNVIKVFTASGDHVATVDHDGTTEQGSASWNLISRNGQEVVSGIYIYSVESDDPAFETFRGRFVVIR